MESHPVERSVAMSDGIKPFEKSQLSTLEEQDKLYRQRDEAKKRAVGQLADYESFKNMVSTAHLAPMDTKVRCLPTVQQPHTRDRVGTGRVSRRRGWYPVGLGARILINSP